MSPREVAFLPFPGKDLRSALVIGGNVEVDGDRGLAGRVGDQVAQAEAKREGREEKKYPGSHPSIPEKPGLIVRSGFYRHKAALKLRENPCHLGEFGFPGQYFRRFSTRVFISAGSGALKLISSPVSGCEKTIFAAWRAWRSITGVSPGALLFPMRSEG